MGQGSVFATTSHFHPSLIFVQLKAPLGLTPRPARKYLTCVEVDQN